MSRKLQDEKRKLREKISAQRTRTTLSYHRVHEKVSNVQSYFSIGRQVALMTAGVKAIGRVTSGNKRSLMTWVRIALLLPTAATLFTYIFKLKKQARNSRLGKPDLPAN